MSTSLRTHEYPFMPLATGVPLQEAPEPVLFDLAPIAHGISVVIEAAASSSSSPGRCWPRSSFCSDICGHLRASFQRYRTRLGQGILLGLEFLVAADIIGNVAVQPTFENLGVLALIVVIRTFLSFSLEVEINGRWPWQGQDAGAA